MVGKVDEDGRGQEAEEEEEEDCYEQVCHPRPVSRNTHRDLPDINID